jgi:hypothetical protein
VALVPWLDLAARRAAVAIDGVAVVASLLVQEQASPQAEVQAPPSQIGSTPQMGLQPSPMSLLPSSQDSLPSARAVAAGGGVQV